MAAFTPPAVIGLAKAYIKPGGKMVKPYGFYHQNKMVGYCNLHYTPSSEEDYWLIHFFIDKRYQRRGLGSEAIKEVLKYIKKNHPNCRRLRLTVHPENVAGKKFYTKLGFVDEHILTFDEPTYSIIL